MDQVINNRWPGHEAIAADPRNVIDHYKYWDLEAIKADLDTRRSQAVVMVENLAADFNIGSVVRNCNAFVVQEIVIVGRRRWDRRGAVGTHLYETLHHAASVQDVIPSYKTQGYTVIAVDNIPPAQPVTSFAFPERSVLLFGQESIGLSPEALDLADQLVYIPQYGSTRSINVGVASGIILHEYMRQHGQAQAPLPSEA